MRRLSVLAGCALVSGTAFGQSASGTALIQWRFDIPGQMLGWTPNRDWSGAMADGHWGATITGKDAILVGPVLEPPVEIGPNGCLEVRCWLRPPRPRTEGRLRPPMLRLEPGA